MERKAHPRGGGSRSSKIQGSGDSRPEWLGGNQSPRTPGVGAIMLGSPMYVTGMNQF